ncbi:MAG: hypothetical protein FWG93_06270, partial [Oscillospiraceae bacterium]|nr:hypothetical protein [Oscillospiraceae bacterium]
RGAGEKSPGRPAALEERAEAMRLAWKGTRLPGADARRQETQRGLAALRESLARDALEYAALLRETEGLLRSCLPDERHRAVMEAHYLGFATWEEAAEQVGYCPRHVKRLHKEALCRVAARRREAEAE